MDNPRPQFDLHSVSRTLDRLRAELSEKQALGIDGASLPMGATEADPSAPDAELIPYVEAAAVLTYFDPDRLNPIPPAARDSDAVRRLLDHAKLVLDDTRQTRWTLRYKLRKRALRTLIQDNRIEAALAANTDQSAGVDDTLQRMFRTTLLGSLPEPSSLDRDELVAVMRIDGWVEGIVQMHPMKEYRQRVELLKLLEPFHHLTGRRVNGAWVEHFQGRAQELSRLRRYAGILEKGLLDTIGGMVPIRSLREKPPLLIYGPGGIGKSTLLAKFLKEHAEAMSYEQFPFVYIDFDRPGLTAQEPLTLLIEAARQLEIQYPADTWFSGAEESFGFLQKLWQAELADDVDSTHARSSQPVGVHGKGGDAGNKGAPDGESQPKVSREGARKAAIRRRLRASAIRSFGESYRRLDSLGQPLLFVLDTFEEVQYRSRDRVKLLYEFLNQLQKEVPLLRTVLAGRAPITEFRTEPLELRELDPAAAYGFLARRGITDAEVAAVIIQHVRGNPLSLRLAADLIHREGNLEELRETLTPERTRLLFQRRFQETEIQGRLYRRILGHIHDPDVRKLAHPGLVLRRLTPELIRDVLAEPCGVNLPYPERSKELYLELEREVSVVMPGSGGELVPRPDVRRAMLQLIMIEKPDQVRDIRDRAVEFYRQRPGLVDRAEEVYHRLALGEPPRGIAGKGEAPDPDSVDGRWLPGIEEYLESSVDELPAPAQAYLASRLGIEASDEIWAVAHDADWANYAAQRARNLIEMGKAAEALDLIHKTGRRAEESPLDDLEIIAEDTVRWEQEGLGMNAYEE